MELPDKPQDLSIGEDIFDYQDESDYEDGRSSPNRFKIKRVVSESEKSCIESGHFCKDPLNISSYTIEWPNPLQMKVLLIRKPNDSSIDEWADKIIALLNSYHIPVIVEPAYYKEVKPPLKVKPLTEVDTKSINAVVTIGGDGTILWANRYFKFGAVPPIIAFAMGTINYMCNFSVTDYVSVLTNGLSLKRTKPSDPMYKLEVKSRIECSLTKDPDDPDQTLRKKNVLSSTGEEIEINSIQAINDITIERGQSLSMTNIECYINGELLTTICADGIIVATPTGSTAYNMAAGGSLVHYKVPAMLFTPVCPFSLSFRPMLFPEDVEITFRVPEDARAIAMVSVDGHTRFELNRKESLKVTVSKFPASYLVDSNEETLWGWCSKIQNIMNWNAKMQSAKYVPSDSK